MNQVATQPPANVFELVAHQEKMFTGIIASDSVTWVKESQFAIQALQKNEFLAKTAWANQASLQNAIINVAAIGISLNPALKHAYLVPRDRMVCLDISYMGLLHLAMQSGAIEWGQAKLVYSNDNYLNNGIDKAPTHGQNTFGDKGDIVGCYCTVKLKSGDYITEEMDINALNKVKGTSKAQNGPWKTWPEEMIRKTVVKRASKYWPSCERLDTAVQAINEHEGLASEEELSEMSADSRDEEVKFLHNLLDNDQAFAFCAFMQTRDEKVTGHFFNSFTKGSVSSGKERVRNLQSKGNEEWKEFLSDIKACIKTDDVEGIKEYLEGFAQYEKRHLLNRLGKMADDLTDLLTGEK